MTSTFWPAVYSGASCVLPEILTKACKSFEKFYLSRHTGRRLTWQPSLGNADVRVQFKARKHDLNVSTFALVILLHFGNLGETDYLTYEVRKQVNLPQACPAVSCQSFAGYKTVDVDAGRRAEAPSAVARLRQVQNPEETSSRSERARVGLVLVQS